MLEFDRVNMWTWLGLFVDLPWDSTWFWEGNLDLSVNEHGNEAMQIQEQKQPRKRPGFKFQLNPEKKKLLGQFFCLLLLLDLVIYFANVWSEREADNTHERRDFLKSSLRPFFHGALQLFWVLPLHCWSFCFCIAQLFKSVFLLYLKIKSEFQVFKAL